MIPAHYQSGKTDNQDKVSRWGEESAGATLNKAAHTLLVRSKE